MKSRSRIKTARSIQGKPLVNSACLEATAASSPAFVSTVRWSMTAVVLHSSGRWMSHSIPPLREDCSFQPCCTNSSFPIHDLQNLTCSADLFAVLRHSHAGWLTGRCVLLVRGQPGQVAVRVEATRKDAGWWRGTWYYEPVGGKTAELPFACHKQVFTAFALPSPLYQGNSAQVVRTLEMVGDTCRHWSTGVL